MTPPTQAQIEAAGVAYWNFYRQLDGKPPEAAFQFDAGYLKAITAALTAAAQVGEQHVKETNQIIDTAIRVAAIHRCAQVADGFDKCDAYSKEDGLHITKHIAAAIRELAQAQVGEQHLYMSGYVDGGRETKAATIERCAQVAEAAIVNCEYNCRDEIVATIRKLKDAP